MNPNPGIDSDRAESEEHIQQLSERVAELEQDNMLLEEVLRRNTRMFEALLSHGQDGITLTGPDMRIVRVVKGLTGIDAAGLIGRPIDTLAVPEDRQIVSDAYHQLLQGHCGRIRIAVRAPQADGTIALYKATLSDMLDDPNVQAIVWNYTSHPAPEPAAANETITRP